MIKPGREDKELRKVGEAFVHFLYIFLKYIQIKSANYNIR